MATVNLWDSFVILNNVLEEGTFFNCCHARFYKPLRKCVYEFDKFDKRQKCQLQQQDEMTTPLMCDKIKESQMNAI